MGALETSLGSASAKVAELFPANVRGPESSRPDSRARKLHSSVMKFSSPVIREVWQEFPQRFSTPGESGGLNGSMQHQLIWNFCSKVVCMTQGQRVALSAAQRTALWSRWKAGQFAARDRARLWPAASLDPWSFIPVRRDCSARSSAFAAGAHCSGKVRWAQYWAQHKN